VVEAGVCVDVEVLRVGVMLAEAEMRPEEDQSIPPMVEYPTGKKKAASRAEGSTAMARTHVKEVGGVVGEMRGTGVELVEGEARAD
jgi:hypothetical protein